MKHQTRIMMIFVLITGALSILIIVSAISTGETYIVDQQEQGDFFTIQEAIDWSSDGDTILVNEGIYLENIVVDKEVSLISNDSANTIIDGSEDGTVVILVSDGINMSGFTVQGSGNAEPEDAGISVEGNNATIETTRCMKNQNGIFLGDTYNNTLSGNNFSNNSQVGIYLDHCFDSLIIDNLCKGNQEAGIVLDSCANNTVTENSCWENPGKGILYAHSQNGTITLNSVLNNEGEGIRLEQGLGVEVSNNSASGNDDDGIAIVDSSDVTITGNEIMFNHENGLYLENTHFSELVDNDCSRNDFIGIYLNFQCDHNILHNNSVNENLDNGMFILRSENNLLTDNSFTSNGLENLLLRESHNNSLNDTFSEWSGGSGLKLIDSNNNSITSSEFSRNSFGINLDASNNNSIDDNLCEENQNSGIYAVRSSNNTIRRNDCFANDISGIATITNCMDNEILENECSFGSLGIFVTNSGGNDIQDNDFSNNDIGIDLFRSDGTTVRNNICFDNDNYGIRLEESSWNFVEDNNLTSNDVDNIILQYANNNTVGNNFCPSADIAGIRLISSHDNLVSENRCPDNLNGILLSYNEVDRRGSGDADENDRSGDDGNSRGGPGRAWAKDGSNNNTIRSNNCSTSEQGIYLDGSSNNTLIENTCDDGTNGIYLHESENNTIIDNYCADNSWAGLWISDNSHNTTAQWNIFIMNEHGIYMEFSDDGNLFGNNASSNYDGISLHSSDRTTIGHSTCWNNEERGILLEESNRNTISNNIGLLNRFGIFLRSGSDENLVEWNDVHHNDRDGIVIYESYDNLIANNTSTENEFRGMWVYDSAMIMVEGNHFLMNPYGLVIEYSETILANGNDCSDNMFDGLEVLESEQCDITNNSCERNGVTAIYQSDSSNVLIAWNSVTHNLRQGIVVMRSSEVDVIDNSVHGSGIAGLIFEHDDDLRIVENSISEAGRTGVMMSDTQDSEITDNLILDCPEFGFIMLNSSNGSLAGNIMRDNGYNFGVWGNDSTHYDHDIDTTNTVNGKLVVYIRDQRDTVYDSRTGAGTFYAIECDNLTIRGLDVSKNVAGIFLWGTNNTSIDDVTIRDNWWGIYIDNNSTGNSIHNSQIYGNDEWAGNAENNSAINLDATLNWWGDDSGPYHTTLNPAGLGDNVTDFVDFIPFLPLPNDTPVASIVSITPISPIKNESVEFSGHGNDPDGEIVQYSWRSSIDGELYIGTESTFETANLSVGTHTISLRVMDDSGAWSVEVSTMLKIKGESDWATHYEGDGFNWWLIFVAILIIVMIWYSYLPLSKK